MGISVSLSAFNMKSAVLLSVLIALAASEDNVVRKPKLFFVSTSATTSTLQTATICYLSFTTLTTCTGRKKRAIEMASDVASLELEPSQKHGNAPAIDDSRDGRFLLYWITTTSISTSTSFTTTFTVSSVKCTHTGANLCG